jgi:fido (protein-threonine AMPylation protein)
MSGLISYSWKPIVDYEVEPNSLAKLELRTLVEIWDEQRKALQDSEGLRTFNERLRREWAIETGLLERIYTLDRGVTQMLIERGIDSSYMGAPGGGQDADRVVAIIRDHQDAMEGLFSFIKGQRELSPSYIKEIHSQLTRHQETTKAVDSMGRLVEVPLIRGAYKTQPNNPTRSNGSVHQYAPPEHVASEIEELIRLHASHSAMPAEVESAWLHHRFTQIHPFQDGNGRVARCLATLVFIRAGYFPLVIRDTRQERARYLDALEAADRGDLAPLVAVFAASQRRAFVQALGISGQVLRLTRAEQVVSATRDRLAQRETARRAEWEKAKATARELQHVATQRLQDIADRLSLETSSFIRGARYFVDDEPGGGARDHYFRWQVIETAKQLDYYANTTEYRAWTRLVMRAVSQAEVLISFHGTGHEFRGVLAVSACFFRREETEAGKSEIADVTPLSEEIFQINYRESPQNAEPRFREWLEEALVKGLELWRAGL